MLALVALARLAAACGPAGTTGQPSPSEIVTETEPVPNPLGVYRGLGFLVGEPRFPAVGNVAYLPGPGDSTYGVFALSLPNAALKFRRDQQLFVARYGVEIVVGDSAAPAAQLDETQEVRVRSFRETSRRDESVVFQAFLALEPGDYPARIAVRDLASAEGMTAHTELHVPRFQPPFVTAPLIVHRATQRETRDSLPSLIINPRATVAFGHSELLIYTEGAAADADLLVLETRLEGQVITTDTVNFRPDPGQLRSATVSLKPDRLPPGTLSLRSQLGASTTSDPTALIVALTPTWVVTDYQQAMSFLRYAATPAALDSLLSTPPGERAHQLQAFWKQKDPVPETDENEFFELYFRRIAEANDRFGEAGTAGWLTDRGAVYITFGPPDEVMRHLDSGQVQEQSQVWVYDKSLDFELRLVFTDPTATGAFRLTVESRRAFREAVQALYS